MVRRFLRTPAIGDASLNWDGMMQVAVGGHFPDGGHTVAQCRDQFIPSVFRRDGRDDCEKNKRRGAFEAARDAALASIAAAPEGGMLDEDQTREIAELAARADEHIVGVYSGRVETI